MRIITDIIQDSNCSLTRLDEFRFNDNHTVILTIVAVVILLIIEVSRYNHLISLIANLNARKLDCENI
jgi:hypothetical protein